jgi:hypothetical protein
MRAHSHATTATPDPSNVLTKAVVRGAEALGMSDAQLAAVIGVSASSLSRMRSGVRTIEPGSKEGELALTFLRMYRSLSALLNDKASCRAWFEAENTHLGGVPAVLVRRVEGLVDVTQYLDAMRGKV